jgi:hypothetical protein
MTQQLSAFDFLATDRGDHLRSRLDDVPGMKFVSEHKWHWTVGECGADVVVEPGDQIHIAIGVANPPAELAALEANRTLPGNLRYATNKGQSQLCADTQLNGAGHLFRTFDDLQTGVLLALGQNLPPEDVKPLAAADVQTAIATCRWPEGMIVQLDNAWEFRTRLRGDATPVRATIDRTELRIYRRVVRNLGKKPNLRAICAQALQFNKQLRHARLSMVDGAVVAESHLHGEQLAPAWLETAAWAVAVACRHTEVVLNILAENDDVADDYATMFLGEKG